MNFDPSEEQRLLADAVGKLLEAHAAVPRDPGKVWRDYADLGLLALPFPSQLGGLGGGPETIMLVMEAYGRSLADAPYLQSILLAGRVLALAGAAESLAPLLSGERRAALCLYEPGARYRWDTPTSSATRTQQGWTVRGHKLAVLDAPGVDMLLWPAATADGLGLFLVPVRTPGLTLDARPTPDGRPAADVQLADITLPADAAICPPGQSRAILAEAIDGATAALCSEAIGAMEALLAITIDYLGVRHQFGAALGSFQALQHRAADMLVAIEQARSITIFAISRLDAPAGQRHVAVAAAKALVNRSARFVGSEAIQLHGGMGLAAEYPAGRYFQRLTVIETLLGDTEHLLSEVERGGGLAI